MRCELKDEPKLRWYNCVGIIFWLVEKAYMHDCILAFHSLLSESDENNELKDGHALMHNVHPRQSILQHSNERAEREIARMHNVQFG